MVLYRPPKRARVQERLSVEKFGTVGCPADYSGPFRTNIRSFLNDFAQLITSQPGVQRWCIPLHSERSGEAVTLFVMEELPFESGVLHCNHCRIIGWSHHPVCRARYHFILPASEQFETLGVGKGHKVCNTCGSVIASSVARCPSCGLSASRTNILEAHSHLLHGILHSNGYGHLLRINGHEGGSRLLSGSDIMDLWDRICTMLRARKVSVLDVSKKFGLNFRLLHGVAKGESWYGIWGYRFGKGSFGITDSAYKKAVGEMANIPLNAFLRSGLTDKKLHSIITHYQKCSSGRVRNLQDLVCYIMELLKAFHRKRMVKPEPAVVPVVVNPPPKANSHRWSTQRLDKTLDVLLSILKEFAQNKWLPRQKLRERARVHIGDTGLLDHSLCSFVGTIVDDQVVQRRHNEQLRQLEYRLADTNNSMTEAAAAKAAAAAAAAAKEKRKVENSSEELEYNEVLEDLRYVYNNVLEGDLFEEDEHLGRVLLECSKTVLDTKHFIKDYKGNLLEEGGCCLWEDPWEEPFRVQCRLEVVQDNSEIEDELKSRGAPSELVVLPRTATVGDLRREATKAFRDVYPSFSKLRAVSIPVLECEEDDKQLSLEGTPFLTMRGTGIDDSSPGRFEKGLDEWVVDCSCGARDDDGERMAACDSCGVWLHTRCANIPDLKPVPQQFFCHECMDGCMESF